MRISEALVKGRELLASSPTASLDAEVLLSYVLGQGRESLFLNAEEILDEGDLKMYEVYLRRAESGEPIAHIINSKEFYGLDFFVDERVLIPRPETEHLVEKVLEYLRLNSEQKKGFNLLDVGTGSGNIPISIVKNFSEGIGHFDALEVSDDALDVARLNAEQHGVDDDIDFIQSDLLEVVDDSVYYDVITANLPYIGTEKNRFVSKEAEQFEPNIALFGGEDGLVLYKKMFQQIVDKDIGFGLMLGEFGFAQGEDMRNLLSQFFDQRWRIEQDLAGIDRLFIVT